MDTRRPPPSGAPPSYAMISRFYRHSLRPVVLTTTAIGGLYAALWGGSAFHDIHGDRQIVSSLGTFDIIIGAFYLGVLVVEAFGFFSAMVQRASLVRIYTLLSVIVALLVMAAEMIRTVLHFKNKSKILSTCLANVTTEGASCDGFFCRSQPLSQSKGQQWCKDWFNRRSVGDILWFLIAGTLSILFSSIAFGYLHQLRSVGERVIPAQHLPLDNLRPPSSGPPYHYDPPDYPPPGPGSHYDNSKVPDYDGVGISGDDKAPGYVYDEAADTKGRDGPPRTADTHDDGYYDGSNPFESHR